MATTAEDSFNVFKPNLEPVDQADNAAGAGGAASESNIEMSQEETKESKQWVSILENPVRREIPKIDTFDYDAD